MSERDMCLHHLYVELLKVVITGTYCHLWHKGVYLPLCNVEDTPFLIQGDEIFCNSTSMSLASQISSKCTLSTGQSVTNHALLSRLAIRAYSLVFILQNNQHIIEGEGWVQTDTCVVSCQRFETHVLSVSGLGITYIVIGVCLLFHVVWFVHPVSVGRSNRFVLWKRV